MNMWAQNTMMFLRFFISGEGIKDVQNLAVVPNTKTPVSVNNINNGSNNSYARKASSNSTFYVSNLDGSMGLGI